jgi:hypothetical protein
MANRKTYSDPVQVRGLKYVAIGTVVLAALLLLSGCSGYMALSQPWDTDHNYGEFDSGNRIQPGDWLRVTLTDDGVVHGTFIDMDDHGQLHIKAGPMSERISIPIDKISLLELKQGSVGSKFSGFSTAALTSVAVYVIIELFKDDKGPFTPDSASGK